MVWGQVLWEGEFLIQRFQHFLPHVEADISRHGHQCWWDYPVLSEQHCLIRCLFSLSHYMVVLLTSWKSPNSSHFPSVEVHKLVSFRSCLSISLLFYPTTLTFILSTFYFSIYWILWDPPLRTVSLKRGLLVMVLAQLNNSWNVFSV